MLRRLVPYGLALLSVTVVAAGLGVVAWALHLPRVESYWAIFIVLVGAIGWRFGRGPAVLGIAAAAVLSDFFFVGQQPGFDVPELSEWVRLVVGLVASVIVIQFVHVSRRREIMTEKRKDLLQDVSPLILQNL